MDARNIIAALPITEWHGPFDTALPGQAIEGPETGRVLLLAHLPFRIAPDELVLLSPSVMGSERKNIGFEQTLHLPVTARARPERSPLRVLENLARRALA
jgi:hypothetical protein